MSVTSHQTVRLSRGHHRSPDDGACVMELVSMLAGEPFTDHPATACPVIGAFLRSYNDLVADAPRQELLTCASSLVGSRRPELQRARVRRCVEVVLDAQNRRPRWRRWLDHGQTRHLARLGEGPIDSGTLADLGYRLARVLARDRNGGRRALALVDELLAVGPVPEPALPTPTPEVAAAR